MITWSRELPADGWKQGGGRPQLQGAASAVVETGKRQERQRLKGQRDIQRQKQRQPSAQLSWSTDLMFTAEIGAACFLKVDTGVGEAETRVYEEIHMNGGHI